MRSTSTSWIISCPCSFEGTSKKDAHMLQGKSPKNQTVHAPVPRASIRLPHRLDHRRARRSRAYLLPLRNRVQRPPMKRIVTIVGPTAVGKTALADALAVRLGGAVVSADAMQVYRAHGHRYPPRPLPANAARRSCLWMSSIPMSPTRPPSTSVMHDARSIS